MAGDYIPMSTGLRTRREVGIIARETGWSTRETIGALYDFWSWAQDETSDGKLRGLTLDDVAKLTAIDRKFFDSLLGDEVKWLTQKDGVLAIPRFSRWMGNAAKKRLKERDKKRRQRGGGPDRNVPKLSPSARDKSGTGAGREKRREEKIREERRKTTLNVGPSASEEDEESESPAEARRATETYLVDQICREFNDEHSRDYWLKVCHRMHPEDVYRAISETRAASPTPSDPRRYLNSRIKAIAADRGVDLESKTPQRARAA